MIPVLDLEEGSETSRCKALVSYLSTVGFVYLKNHGIPKETIESCHQAAHRFFGHDLDFKEAHNSNDPYKYVGYKGFESEKLNPKRKQKDMRESIIYDGHHISSNQWPDANSEGQTVPLIKDLLRLAGLILQMIGAGLELENPSIFWDTHTSVHSEVPSDSKSLTSFRINHYPELQPNQLKKDQVLCGEHADCGTLTFFLQRME